MYIHFVRQYFFTQTFPRTEILKFWRWQDFIEQVFSFILFCAKKFKADEHDLYTHENITQTEIFCKNFIFELLANTFLKC